MALLAVTLALIGYDVYATLQGYENTITYIIRTLSKNHPAIPWSIGLLFGYWLGKAKGDKPGEED